MLYLKEEGLNFVREEIRAIKRRLEVCKPEELLVEQTRLKVYRSLLETEKEPETTKEDENDFLGL